MKAKELSLLQFNDINWTVSRLGEKVLLLEAACTIKIEDIHASVNLIKRILKEELVDIVPAYDSIALFGTDDCTSFLEKLRDKSVLDDTSIPQVESIEIPICYEKGHDIAELAENLEISLEEWINIHLSGKYRSLFIGFTPGFIYADGLDKRLSYPRKKTPRTRIPAGSVGIGGEQTGIYSLDSPGGWNIIGRTPIKLFDAKNNPPMKISVGTSFFFRRINLEEFEAWQD